MKLYAFWGFLQKKTPRYWGVRKGFYIMSINNYTIEDFQSQVSKILLKTQIKKKLNERVVDWLFSERLYDKALEIQSCANHVGITNINNIAHIVKADFCRNRICNICAWRRQSKFMAQMFPVLEKLGNNYQYLFVTLTVKNIDYENLSQTIDMLMSAYDKFLKRRKIKRAWVGKIRGLEITYNRNTQTFHPHIHIFVAVKPSYFEDPSLYITHEELSQYWQECINADYIPICHIEKVTETSSATIETLKYSFKTSSDNIALKGYFYSLKNRRLVSFSGVFAETRKFLKQSDFETILTDDISPQSTKNILYSLYKFDATGGIYKYYDSIELYIKKE